MLQKDLPSLGGQTRQSSAVRHQAGKLPIGSLWPFEDVHRLAQGVNECCVQTAGLRALGLTAESTQRTLRHESHCGRDREHKSAPLRSMANNNSRTVAPAETGGRRGTVLQQERSAMCRETLREVSEWQVMN